MYHLRRVWSWGQRAEEAVGGTEKLAEFLTAVFSTKDVGFIGMKTKKASAGRV